MVVRYYADACCFAFDPAGVVGPWLIGWAKTEFGGFTMPMLIMAVLSFFGVAYFAVLLRYLPTQECETDNEAAALL